MKKYKYLLLGIFVLLVISSSYFFSQSSVSAKEKPAVKSQGQYIVVLKDSVGDPDRESDDISKKHGGITEHKYKDALKGFSATFDSTEIEDIKKDPRVAFVSEDKEVHISAVKNVAQLAQTIPNGITRIGIGASPSANKGTGIGVAVIDTGIDLTHPDLVGNIGSASKSCIRRKTAKDDNGHGTHVAGTVAGRDNTIGVVGVAPEAKLFAVKVLNSAGSGRWSEVICGIDWVAANAQALNIKVANMSLGGGGASDNNCGNTNNDALHKAVCRLRDAGVTTIVAAGNEGKNASNSVPAAYDDAVITVSALADSDGQAGGAGGATTYGADDTFASFSNFGSVVDLGAPGVSIFSTYKNGGYATLSGTSMAAPHMAGSAALYVASHPGSSWTQVRDGLQALAEALGAGHTDPSGLHPEPVVRADSL